MELQKRLIRPLAAWLAGLLLCCAPSAALASGGGEAAGGPQQAALTDEDLERTVFARGCVLIDASDPEAPLYAKNPDAPIIPASTAKIMTCILAIEMAGDLNAAVAVPDEAARLGGSNSRMGLVRGESLPMRDLLYGLMLVSANDAALAIACHLAGSAEDFAALMNGKAAALGMEDTRFAAPSGVYRSGYTSTAHDMARLMAYAMRNGTFRQIVSAAEYTVPANGVRRHELHLVNSNRLISDPETSSYYYEYAIDGKTGTTTVGGKCLVAVAERDGAVLIASLMGARDEKRGRGWLENRCFADAKGLFERAYELLYTPATAEALGCAGRICGDGPRIAVSCGRRLRGGLRPASAAPPQERGMNCCAAAGRRVFLQIFCPAVRNFSLWQPQVAQSCLYRARRIRYDGGEVRHMCRQDGRAADAARERDGRAAAEGAGRADAMDGELGGRIRAQRVRCGLSQEQLAGQVGVSRQAVTKWETGRAAPGAAHLFRLAQALGTTVDLLLPRAGTGADGADAARAAQEARIRARRMRWKRRGALALAVAGAYLLLYLAGRLADGDLSQRTVLEVLFGRDDPAAGGYLFGWLLSRRLLLVSFAASVLPALLGAPRLSLAALAGCLLGLLLGEAFGPVPGGAALGHGHCGWAIWCGVSLLSLAFGALLERRCRRGMALRSRGFLLWCAAFLLCAALVCLLARLGAAPPAGY